jgi:hypothetical protein
MHERAENRGRGDCLFVFAALLVMDTADILGLAFSWVIGGPAYRWIRSVH